TGFVNMLVAARDAGVERFVYASSSAVYGDHPALPKVEAITGRAMSPYGLTKAVNELYADVFDVCYGFKSIGLRYFNVFGPRQDPNGAYASVIPAWIGAATGSSRARTSRRRRGCSATGRRLGAWQACGRRSTVRRQSGYRGRTEGGACLRCSNAVRSKAQLR